MEHEERDYKRYEMDREGMEYARNSINEGSSMAKEKQHHTAETTALKNL